MIEEITGYQTTDGEVFINYEDAEAHQLKLDFYKYYKNNPVYADYRGDVSAEDILDWLNKHSREEEVRNFLKCL
jgi:hypothetical protein